MSAAPEVRAQGEVVVYRLDDVGYAIDLEAAAERLAGSAPERVRPVRGEAQAIRIPNPPLTVSLGHRDVALGGTPCRVAFSARLFDFGVLSLRARVEVAEELPWNAFVTAAARIANAPEWREIFAGLRAGMLERMRGALTKPGESPVSEDYVVFRVHRLTGAGGDPLPASALADDDVARLLVDETRPLSAAARRDLLSPRFSYYEDDLAVLTWNGALVVEPVAEDHDVQYVLEFANAQLLELRFYDARLDEELPRIFDRIEMARSGFHVLGRGYSRLLVQLQTRVAEVTEVVERTENALKVTDDVFLARIYAAALEIFRGRAWREAVDNKLAILRDAYAMLNGESQARRSEALELTIVLLIVLEIVLAFWR